MLLDKIAEKLATLDLELDVKGGATWAPVRDPAGDFSLFGDWEAWEFCAIGALPSGAVGAIPSGDWIAWDSQTGRVLGFNRQSAAEMFAVLQNNGEPTRVVRASGEWALSTVDYAGLAQQVEAHVSVMEKRYTEGGA